MRRVLPALCLTAFCCAAGVTSAEDLRVSPAQARVLAIEALQRGQPALAAQLAQGLLLADRANGEAHFILARAYQLMRQPDLARKPARLAFAHATTTAGKFQAAQFAARLAIEDQKHLAAQIWLRRSLLHLPDERFREQVVKDYRLIRRMSPWQLSLQTSLAPTDNLNNGADSPYSTIDGVPIFGFLSGSAQALSGVRGTADLGLSYRLSGTKAQSTHVSLRYYGQRVDLSDEARAQAPSLTNSSLAFDYLELGLSQNRKAKGKGQWSFGASLGQSWSSQDPYQQTLRVNLGRGLELGKQNRLSVTAQAERLRYESGLPDVTSLSLHGTLSHQTAADHRFSLSLSLKDAQSRNANARQQKVSATLGWASGAALGPVTPSASLGASLNHYADYSLGFFAVPGGREDRSVFGQMEFTLQALDYGGFVPSLTVQARKTTSNVSRFETRETTVSLGVKSSF